jgi:hypothetical protein
MTDQDRLYDLYLTAFGKVRAGVQMTSADFKTPAPASLPYLGLELAAVVQGIADGKALGGPSAKADLMRLLNGQMT